MLAPTRILLMFNCFSLIYSIMDDGWDVAVVTNDQIELLTANGTLIGSQKRQFTKLKALTFDSLRRQFIVSDMDQRNDTILAVKSNNKETDITTIVEDLPDDVQGLAYDPFSDALYWTDSLQKTINYVNMSGASYDIQPLFNFTQESPQDITIDVCNRLIYWTNSNVRMPTIERSRLDGTHREVVVDANLHKPSGIAIDRRSQRLYWADVKEGIYFTIESMTLSGDDHRIEYQGTHCKPFGLSVDNDAIYFTDINNNALWRLSKTEPNRPDKIRTFPEQPMGVVSRASVVATLPDCFNVQLTDKEVEEVVTSQATPSASVVCLNGGREVKGACLCVSGFSGEFCQVSICHNYCLHGNCRVTSHGQPWCECNGGYVGKRCERHLCLGRCLNNATCQLDGVGGVMCDCKEGWGGERCEEWGNACWKFCRGRGDDVISTESGEILCRCVQGEPAYNLTAALPLVDTSLRHPLLLEHFQDPAFLLMACAMLLMLITIIALVAFTCTKRKRCKPKIRKRIIVNRNVTPLTYRPGREQCEITIENCCNMNVCDTPCFEPPTLLPSSTYDDKKQLLANMEHGDD